LLDIPKLFIFCLNCLFDFFRFRSPLLS